MSIFIKRILLPAVLSTSFLMLLNESALSKPQATDVDLSYTLGFITARNLMMEPNEIDPTEFHKGFLDAFSKKNPSVPSVIFQTKLKAFQVKHELWRRNQMTKISIENAKEGKEFAKKYQADPNSKKLPNGVLYKVLEEGKGIKPTSMKDIIIVEYESRFVDGHVYDISKKHAKPVKIMVGQTLPGWRTALVEMPKGSTWEVVVPPKLAYGLAGNGGMIGPNKTLIFKIKLVDVIKPPKEQN